MINLFVTLLICCFGLSFGQPTTNINNDRGKCGTRVQDDDPERVRVVTTMAGRVPWHVGIYRYDSTSNLFKHICGGTIILPDIVLTAATCIYGTISIWTNKPDLFRITAGKLAYDWYSTDLRAQEMAVKEIVVPQTFLGNINSNADNLALLKLTADLRLNDLVRPICFDFNNRINKREDSYLQTAGWGLDGGVSKWPFLKEANFQYLNNAECTKRLSDDTNLRFINDDKICLLTPGGRTDYDSGGGLVYKKDNKYHLVGILSDYINNELTPATNLSGHLTWINKTIELFDRSKRCRDGFRCFNGVCINKAQVCNGVLDCPDGTDETEETCPSATTAVNIDRCREGFRCFNGECINKALVCNGVLDCPDGTDETEKTCPSATPAVNIDRKCKPLVSDIMNIECSYGDFLVRCDRSMNPGTKARTRCKPRYNPEDFSLSYQDNECMPDGVWKLPLVKCISECGIENDPFFSVGPSFRRKTKYNKYPWHVGIYGRFDTTGNYTYLCSGALIAENMLLTVAHCMFSSTTATPKRLNEDNLMIAAGKFYVAWNRQEEYQQTSSVTKILIAEGYRGIEGNFIHDIALLKTESLFKLNEYVLPACIDYSALYSTFVIGFMVGWGKTGSGELREELQEFQLPIIKNVECQNSYSKYSDYITPDKFCVPYRTGDGPEAGASGGGVTILRQGRHYLQGIISTRIQDHFCGMTNVSMYLGFIKANT